MSSFYHYFKAAELGQHEPNTVGLLGVERYPLAHDSQAVQVELITSDAELMGLTSEWNALSRGVPFRCWQ